MMDDKKENNKKRPLNTEEEELVWGGGGVRESKPKDRKFVKPPTLDDLQKEILE